MRRRESGIGEITRNYKRDLSANVDIRLSQRRSRFRVNVSKSLRPRCDEKRKKGKKKETGRRVSANRRLLRFLESLRRWLKNFLIKVTLAKIEGTRSIGAPEHRIRVDASTRKWGEEIEEKDEFRLIRSDRAFKSRATVSSGGVDRYREGSKVTRQRERSRSNRSPSPPERASALMENEIVGRVLSGEFGLSSCVIESPLARGHIVPSDRPHRARLTRARLMLKVGVIATINSVLSTKFP